MVLVGWQGWLGWCFVPEYHIEERRGVNDGMMNG